MLADALKSTRFEKVILRDSRLLGEIRSALAGASRATRLSRERVSGLERPVVEVASGFLGPLAFLFTWWLLRQARESGVRRLYFLARDGYLLKKVAEILVERWGLDLDLRYLHASREAWLLPSFHEVTDFEISWITWGHLSSISFSEICRRLRIDAADLVFLREDPELSSLAAIPDAPLCRDGLEKVKKLLRRSGLVQLVRKRNEESYETTLGYLREQGVLDGEPLGLVDTGWGGSCQYALSLLLQKAGARTPKGTAGFYLGLNKNKYVFNSDKLSAFLFDWSQTGIDYRMYNFLCFEMLFATNEGRTLGYALGDGAYVPVADADSADRMSWMIDIQHDCAIQYADYASRVMGYDNYDGCFPDLCRNLSRLFISRPSREEASVYGEFLIAGEITERDLQRIAPPLSYTEFLQVIMGKRKIKGFWPQGSIARSDMKLGEIMYGMVLDMKLLDWYRRVFLKY